MKRLTLKLEKLTASTGINIDEELGNDMQAIVNNHQPDINAMKNDDFHRIFWEQQVHHTYMYMFHLLLHLLAGQERLFGTSSFNWAFSKINMHLERIITIKLGMGHVQLGMIHWRNEHSYTVPTVFSITSSQCFISITYSIYAATTYMGLTRRGLICDVMWKLPRG